jgi:tRNA pseudouridine32 synthase/23S rRNA pseudouridine746 synthase
MRQGTNEMREIAVLWVEEDILAVDKPAGMVSSPRWVDDDACLPALLERMGYGRLFIVHRLDKAVSGVMLYARHRQAHAHLSRQFSQRRVRKTYTALVHGELERSSGLIERPIRQFGSGRMGVDARHGVACLTRFERLRRLAGYTLLRVVPHTGRRHQIRVHLYSIGHAVVGDLRYGDRVLQSRYPRLMLHSSAIDFASLSGEIHMVESALPLEFSRVLRELNAGQVIEGGGGSSPPEQFGGRK